MKKLWNHILAMWHPVVLGLLSMGLIGALFSYRLGTLTPGLNSLEVMSFQSAENLRVIFDNPINAPYKLSVYAATSISRAPEALRSVNTVLGLMAVGLFYLFARTLVRRWVAIGTTVLFATNTLLLNTARLATPDIMWFALLALVAAGYMVRFYRHQGTGWIVGTIILALALYTPGMIVFVIAGVLWQFRQLRRRFEELESSTIIICSSLLALLLAPIAVSLIRTPELWRGYLGIPETFAPLSVMVRAAAEGLGMLFALSPVDPVRWVGRQPTLDVFAGALFIYGFVALVKKYKLDRFIIFVMVFVLTSLGIAITANPMTALILLPFIYLIVGMGMNELLRQWFSVFPRNPIARYVGTGLMVIATLLTINFHTQRYFVAWANNNETKQVFQDKLPL